MKHRNAKPNLCPYCGYFFDMAAAHDGGADQPSPGAISLCLNCGEAGIFTDDLSTRKMTDQEYDELPIDQKHALVQALLYCKLRGPIERKGSAV